MKSRLKIKYSRYVIMTGVIAVALVGCSKGQNNQRLGQNANAPIPGTAPVGPNGIYMINGIPCNIHDLNPQSITSPLYQGPNDVYNPAITTQQPQQIVNQAPIVPGQQQQQIIPGQQQIGPNGQPQQGQIVAPNYGVPPTHNDIPNDTNTLRIIEKQFQLTLGAYASQNASDTCALDKDKLDADISSKVTSAGNETRYDYVRFLTPPGSVIRSRNQNNNDNPDDRFDFFFNNLGQLRVSAESYIMQASSDSLLTPVDYNPSNPPKRNEYALEQGANILHIGPFRMKGNLSQKFTQYETYLATILKHQELENEKNDNDIDGPIPEPGQSQSSSQNQITFSGGHAPTSNSSSINGGPDRSGIFQPQNLGHPNLTSPNVVIMDIGPISADIKLLQANPQHITGLQINQIDWESYANIDTVLGPDKCLDDSKGHFYNVFLKKVKP